MHFASFLRILDRIKNPEVRDGLLQVFDIKSFVLLS